MYNIHHYLRLPDSHDTVYRLLHRTLSRTLKIYGKSQSARQLPRGLHHILLTLSQHTYRMSHRSRNMANTPLPLCACSRDCDKKHSDHDMDTTSVGNLPSICSSGSGAGKLRHHRPSVDSHGELCPGFYDLFLENCTNNSGKSKQVPIEILLTLD